MNSRLFFTCAIILIGAMTLTAQSGTTAEGIKYTILQAGTGPSPKMGQEVIIQGEVLDSTGKVVWSSRDLGYTPHFQLGKETDPESKAHDLLLTQMKKGAKYREEFPNSLLAAENPASKKQGYQVTIIELVDVMDAKPAACDLFVETAEKSGIAAAEAEFKALQKSNPKGYSFFEWDINTAAYKALEAKKVDIAIALLSLNNTLFPNSANTYDSLADAYAAKGDKEKAKANYLKAFQMNPKFTASKKKMEKL